MDDRLAAELQRQLPAVIEELKDYCRLRSISAQGMQIAETAQFVREAIRRSGLEARVEPTEGGHPVVVGHGDGRSQRRLLFYNHYDVQPPEPLALWQSPPFEPEVREGKLFARGVADNKANLMVRLGVVRALRAAYGELPCRVSFVVEGEEEISSPRLPGFIAAHREELAADGCIWETGGVDEDDRPAFVLGMRGICYVELRARTAARDAHSGLGGSMFPNAAWRLTWALAGLKGTDERIRLPGFYDPVRPPSAEDLALLEALPSREEQFRTTYGFTDFLKGMRGLELKRDAIFQPTCTICGLTAGYQGPGSKTVLPAEAGAKVDFRLVPDQMPEQVVEQLRRHLDGADFPDVEIAWWDGEPPARVYLHDPFIQLALRTAEEVYGRPPAVSPMAGGSGPIYAFVKTLGVPVAQLGVGYPDSRAHAPNEHVRLDLFPPAMRALALLMQRMGAGE